MGSGIKCSLALYHYVGEGRHPTFQVCKIKGIEDGGEDNSLYHDPLDLKIDSMLDDNALMDDNDLSDHDERSLESHQSNEENSSEDKEALCLFLYGVRYHLFATVE